MTLCKLIGAGFCLAVFATAAVPVCGQGGYSPPSPFSPYLQLLNRNNGPLPNYQTYVVPMQNQQSDADRNRSVQQAMQGDIQQNSARVNTLGSGFVRSTGRVGGYMNYLHFYPPAGQPVGPGLPNVASMGTGMR